MAGFRDCPLYIFRQQSLVNPKAHVTPDLSLLSVNRFKPAVVDLIRDQKLD